MSHLGIKGWVGFRKEAVAGTAETGVTWFYPSESFNLTNKHEMIDRKADIDVIGSLPALKGKYMPTGKLDGELIAGLIHPLYYILGAVTTTTLSGGAYTHVISGHADGTLPSLTCEGNEIEQSHRQAGVLMDSVELDCAAGEAAGLKIGWLAKTHNDAATLTSVPSYKTDVLTFAGAVVTLGTTALADVGAANLKIDNALEQVHALTTDNRYPAEVRRKSVPKISGKLTFIDYPTAEYTRLKEASTFKLTLYFEGDIIGTSAYKRSLTIEMYCCQYSGGFEPDVKDTVITTDGEFTCYYSTGDASIMKITAVNDVASLTP